MNIKRVALAFALVLSGIPTGATGQQRESTEDGAPAGNKQFRAEMTELRDQMFAAYERRDLDGLLANCTDEIVITWQNGQRNIGHQEFRAFYAEMMNGDNPIVKDISTEFTVDDASILYGDDTAVARGTVADHFVLASGSEFLLNSKWTATVVKANDGWKVASFHVSASIFDNPILATAKGLLVKVGAISAVSGLLLGFIIARLLRKRAAS